VLSRRRVIVVIDEVQLHGVDPRLRGAVGDALGQALAGLAAARPPSRGAALGQLRAAPIALSSPITSAALGNGVAERAWDAASGAGTPARSR
jgi:hypothetical protein